MPFCLLCAAMFPLPRTLLLPCLPQVVIADTFTSLSVMHFGADAWSSQRSLLLLAVGLLLLPACFPRNLQAMGEQKHSQVWLCHSRCCCTYAHA